MKLRHILEFTQEHWDCPAERQTVRENFRKVCLCRTAALGGEVFASATEEKVVYHTCKSKCCPSCGSLGTRLWQREQWAALPDIPFVGVVLTMPNVFWPVFRSHSHLQHDLPALGAAVLKQWAWARYGVRLCVMVVLHSFGGRLNHHPHLHIMSSAGGLDPARVSWNTSLIFDREEIMDLWRFAITSYLWKAYRDGLLKPHAVPTEFNDLIQRQIQRGWNVYITKQMSKSHFLRYAGRYIRRLPISQRRILSVTDKEVVYQSKDTRTGILIETRATPPEFVALLSDHVLDHYRHSMRYFGLLAPRARHATSSAIFLLLGQTKRPRPPRPSWRSSLIQNFKADPLRDSKGQPMRWVRSL